MCVFPGTLDPGWPGFDGMSGSGRKSGDERLTVRPMYFKALMTTFADPHGALTFLEQALALARQYHDRRIEALSLATKGQMYAQIGQFAQSQENMQRAYQILPEVDSP